MYPVDIKIDAAVAEPASSFDRVMSEVQYRPIVQNSVPRSPEALSLAGGPLWFDTVVAHAADGSVRLLPARVLSFEAKARLSGIRAPICGLTLDHPRIMGVLNVTPDSFSDAGAHYQLRDAVARGHAMLDAGADILDIGGESTRPGAEPVQASDEMERVLPVIAALRADNVTAPISIDTRNAAVARAAFDAGANFFNDVSALTYDQDSLNFAARGGHPVCLMHAKGEPRTMQDAPRYSDVLLEVLAFLEARVLAAEAAGIPRAKILIDPGIGFGKTVEHNVALVRGLAIFHGLGCGLLLGASRKHFIGLIGNAPDPANRVAGSIAVALDGLRQGAQVLRVHDVAETRQALAVWSALNAPAKTEGSQA